VTGRATSHRAAKDHPFPALVLGNCYFDRRRSFEDFDWNVLQVGQEFEQALADAGYTVVPTAWTKDATLCYHRHRRSSTDLFGTSATVKIVCLDCGARAEAGYGSPIPDLPPMPIEAGPDE
jgi:hypothetical protein